MYSNCFKCNLSKDQTVIFCYAVIKGSFLFNINSVYFCIMIIDMVAIIFSVLGFRY